VVAGGTPPRRWRRALAHGVRRGIALLTSLALVIGPTPLGMLTGRPVVAAPIGFDGTTTYTQDFQGFSTTTGTSSITVQQMAEVSTLAGGGSVSGWYVYNQAGWATGNRWFAADGGASSTGGFRSMYSSSNGNLALGAQGSGNSVAFYGIVLQNLSGATINNVTMGFDAVLSRNPSTTVNNSAVSYRVSPTTVTTSATSAGAGTFNNSAGTWTTTALGFSSPSAGNPGAPGTQTPFNPMLTIASRSGNLTGLNWGANEYLYIRLSESDEGGSDATMGIDNFSFSQLQAASLTWNLAGGGVWDTSTANFTNGTTSVPFANGDQVTFNNAAGGTIALTGALAPSTMTVSAAAGTYTFSGATAADKITGATGITKSGAGTLVLTSANDYVGGTTINGGTVQISAADQLGSGAVSLGGGTLRSAAASATTLTNAISVGAAGGTIDTGGQNLQIGNLTSAGVLTKSGAGDLTVAGAITSGAGTGFMVDQGNVVLGSGPTAGGVYNIAANSTLTGNLVLSGTQRLNVNDNATISGSGKIQLTTSGALISNLSGNVGGTVAAGITVNSGSQAFTPAAWTGATYTPGSFQATIGATTGGSLTVTGVISGDTDVDLSNSTAGGGGTGLLVLGAQNTYTGNTTINANTPTVATASIRLGVANALPTTTGVVVGTKTGLGAAVLDLNGFNQQVAYLADGPTATVGATKNLTIRNDGAGDATLTIDGSVTPGKGFGGVIGTGTTNRINVVKAGANTQTLTGANTYTGSTTINGGTLALAGAGSINASPTITVGPAGTFDVSAVSGGYAVANGQTLGGSGTVVGATTVASGGRVAPGPGIATLTMGDLTLGAGGTYDFQLFDATGAAGVGWDLITAGTVGLPSTPAFTINLVSASNSGGAAGNAVNFNNSVVASWRIIAASAFGGTFNAANFSVNTAGFSNDLGGGTFSVSDSGADGTGLYVVFNPGASLDWIGGDGPWSATGGTDWSGGGWDPTKTAVFNAPAGTVTIDAGGVSADRGLTFNANGYTVTGGPLTLGGTTAVANTISVASGSATVASVVTAVNGITKAGAGTLVVAGVADAAGGIVVTSGELQIGSGGTTGALSAATAVTLGDGTTLTVNRSDAASIDGVIGGGSGTVRTVGGDLALSGPIDGGLTLLNTGTATLTAAGSVGGAVKITNSGSGTIALTGPSVTTTGAVTASGGTIAFGDAGLGSGPVTVSNNARLLFDGTTPATIANPITIDASGGTIAVAAGDTLALAGTVTRTGLLTKAGAGTLSLPTLPTTNLSIAAGTLAVAATSTQTINTDLGDLFDGGKLAYSGNGVRVNLNVSQTGTGAIVFTQSGQSVAQSGSSLNAVISNPIELTLTSGTINIGTTSGNTLVLNGPITGTGDVNFAVGSAGGAGTTVLGAQSTFSGNVTVNSSATTGVHRLGIDNALPTTAGVTFGATGGSIDLAGFDQGISGLAGGGAGAGGIVNSSADVSRLTINGAANTSYAGRIGSAAKAAIELVKDGSGTQTLTGSNAYTGATRVLAGTLALSGAGSIAGSSIIEVRSGATFDVAGLASPFSLAAGQTLAGAGTVNGPVVLATGTVSPGVAGVGGGIGTLSTGDTTLGNGTFLLQMTNASARAGVGWDLLQTTSLVLPGAGELFTIGLASVLGNGSPGLASGFDSTAAGSWRIVGTTDLVGTFDASRFAVNTADFANSLGGGSFSVTNAGADGTGLYLSFTPVPEPSTIALLGIAIGVGGWRLRRKRRKG
jgi:autotransporter-associated beta strand protein